ncbi:hypothetical protein RRG08_047800 [Elysia crispata]|uniref:Uncharacterized protein n=1 Tax=Elysia crispata TaxID=231223 RepID=A0AAE0Y2R9_9GAST|nr:hypothetical protein RRG08_047800 [Elysia crispata]
MDRLLVTEQNVRPSRNEGSAVPRLRLRLDPTDCTNPALDYKRDLGDVRLDRKTACPGMSRRECEPAKSKSSLRAEEVYG